MWGLWFSPILVFACGGAIVDCISVSNHDIIPPSYPSCFTEGTTWSPEEADDTITEIQSVYSCQDLCLGSSSCLKLTWYNEAASCVLYGATTAEYPCTNCVSGPKSCTCGGQFQCKFNPDNFIGQISHVQTEILCQDYCFKSNKCRYYNWMDEHGAPFHNVCLLFSSCDEKLFNCHTCHSGLGDCGNIEVLSSTKVPSKTSTTISSSSSTSVTTSSTIISTAPTTTATIPSPTSTPSTTATTSSTPSPTSTPCPASTTTLPCDIPEAQVHGNWFCPTSSNLATCHLECDPGYVSNNVTVITCQDGVWSSVPTCVAAVALITGGYPFYHTVEIYGAGLHKKLPDLPDNRYTHSLDIVNSLVLICGGLYTNTSCLTLTSSHQWTLHSITTSSRFTHSSVSMLGKLHLLGGQVAPSTTEHLAPPSDLWHRSWNLLETSQATCAAKIEPEVLMMTGGSYFSSSVVLYNVTSGLTTRLQDLIIPRHWHGCVHVRHEGTGLKGVLVAGGNNGGYLSSSEMYDLSVGEWSVTGELTTARAAMRMLVLEDQVLALGGYDDRVLSSVDTFNITSKLWTAAENMLEARWLHGVTQIPPSAVGIQQK